MAQLRETCSPNKAHNFERYPHTYRNHIRRVSKHPPFKPLTEKPKKEKARERSEWRLAQASSDSSDFYGGKIAMYLIRYQFHNDGPIGAR